VVTAVDDVAAVVVVVVAKTFDLVKVRTGIIVKKQFCFSRFALKLVKHVLKGVDFNNILCVCFLYERLFGSFSLVTFGLAPKFCTKNAHV